MIATPCIGVCSTAVGDEVCFGCGRTFSEVSAWLTLSDVARTQVSEHLSRRKAWLQMAALSGGRLTAVSESLYEATLALTSSYHLYLGWPQLQNGLAHIPLRNHQGKQIMLPVYKNDWIICFWSFVFDADNLS